MAAPRATRLRLGVATLGGGGAWLGHLVAIWAIAEFGCVAGVESPRLAGLPLVSWLVLATTAFALLLALGAAAVAAALARRGAAAEPWLDPADPRTFLARLGLVLDGAFAVAIAYQAVPVYYFLQGC